MSQSQPSIRQQAAVFADYDNLLDVIRAEHSGNQYPDEYAAEILSEVQRYIKNRNDLPTSITRAYADFGALDDDAPYIQRDLQRHGFEPRYVPTDLQRNAAEMQVALDVVQLLHTHASVDTVVLVSGDRPYLPLIRRVVEQGCKVLAVMLFPPHADDVPFFVKDDVFLDARTLLSDESRQAFPDSDRSAYETPARLEPHEYQSLTDPIVRRTVEVTDIHFGQYDEVYLTPLLRKLSDVLGPDHDPKSPISRLEDAGAVRLEKRNGYPYDYTVLIMHDDHPDVQDIKNAHQTQSGYGDGYYDEGDGYDDYGDREEPYTPAPDDSESAATDDYNEPAPYAEDVASHADASYDDVMQEDESHEETQGMA